MKKVLIIDDDSDLLKLYSQAFLNANYEVITCKELFEASELVQHNKYDVILLDLMFPSSDALPTIQLIRTPNSLNSKTPILVLTNLDSGKITKKAIEYGADKCLFKTEETPKSIFKAAVKLSAKKTISAEE